MPSKPPTDRATPFLNPDTTDTEQRWPDIHNPETWVRLWEKYRNQTLSEHLAYLDEDYWDLAAAAYEKSFTRTEEEQIEREADEMLKAGYIFKGATVLDVGCGTGQLSLAMARRGAIITAVDFSRDMLAVFEKKITKDLEPDITIVHADWRRLDLVEKGWEKAFDLASAHMTPAIDQPQDLFRLMMASRGNCYRKGWLSRTNSLKPLLQKALMPEYSDSKRPPTVWLEFNLLMAMGVYPRFEVSEKSWSKKLAMDDAVAQYTKFYAKKTGRSPNRLEPDIRKILMDHAGNGIVQSESTGQYGLMFFPAKNHPEQAAASFL